MSFKQTVTELRTGLYAMGGTPVPVTIIMTPQLLLESEELLWQEVAIIANLPGVKQVVVTPDAHASGNGIPVGVAVQTENTLIACAAGYDISCGMEAVKTNLKASDLEDASKVRKWIDEVELRVATGAGTHKVSKQKIYSDREYKDILFNGALAITKDKNILSCLERTFLPVNESKLVNIQKTARGRQQLGTLGGGKMIASLCRNA